MLLKKCKKNTKNEINKLNKNILKKKKDNYYTYQSYK